MTQAAPVPTGLAVLEMAQAGRFAEMRDMFAPQLRAMAPAEALQAVWAAEISTRGAVSSVGEPVSEPAGPGGTVVKIPVTFERGKLTVVVSAGDEGWLTGIQLAPAGAARPAGPWQPPPYADPAAFDEQDVTVGTGPLAVPGTLSLPRQPGPRTAVVLLGGSGPADRDETMGRNKPLKDLAWGLASRGVRRCVSTRSRTPTAGRSRRFATSRWPTSTWRTRSRPSTCSGSTRPSTQRGSSWPATAWAAPPHRGQRRQSRPWPAWSSWPAGRSHCTGPPCGRSAISPRWTRRRPPHPSPPSTSWAGRRG